MKTTDILKIFDIRTTLPARTLRNDKEILDFVKNCLALGRNSMDDSISRQAVKDWFCTNYCSEHNKCEHFEKGDCNLMNELYSMPSVTPKQRTGHWIEKPEIKTSAPEYLMFYECSECGDEQCFCKLDIHKKHFCNNCGAKMESEENHDE